MKWNYFFLPEAEKEFGELDHSVRIMVAKAIDKVSQNPLPASEGGYGKPLGSNLSGLLKIKLVRSGIRVVYKLRRTETEMLIIVVGMRADDEVYEEASRRRKKYGL